MLACLSTTMVTTAVLFSCYHPRRQPRPLNSFRWATSFKIALYAGILWRRQPRRLSPNSQFCAPNDPISIIVRRVLSHRRHLFSIPTPTVVSTTRIQCTVFIHVSRRAYTSSLPCKPQSSC